MGILPFNGYGARLRYIKAHGDCLKKRSGNTGFLGKPEFNQVFFHFFFFEVGGVRFDRVAAGYEAEQLAGVLVRYQGQPTDPVAGHAGGAQGKFRGDGPPSTPVSSNPKPCTLFFFHDAGLSRGNNGNG
jgi:hypothetical protein